MVVPDANHAELLDLFHIPHLRSKQQYKKLACLFHITMLSILLPKQQYYSCLIATCTYNAVGVVPNYDGV